MENDVTISKMALRPRLVIELDDAEFLAQMRLIAAKKRITVRQAVIEAIGDKYPEIKKIADKELGRD